MCLFEQKKICYYESRKTFLYTFRKMQNTEKIVTEYSAYRDEEYERMRIEMEKRRAERRAREHRRVMKNRIICLLYTSRCV